MNPDLYTLVSEDLTVTLVPALGARLHGLEAFGHSLLRTPGDLREHARDPFYWGAYHMAPWCNRLDTTPVRVGGSLVALTPNFPDGSAIHGQVYDVPWRVAGDGRFDVIGGGNGWPWTYRLRLHVAVAGTTLRLRYTLTNTSDTPMPAGVGLHPWFTDPVQVRVPARHAFGVNADTPARPRPVDGALDLNHARPLPDDVDATWTGLTTPTVDLAWPTTGITATLHIDAHDPVVVGANPAHLDATAVEPQTHAPAGLRRLLRGQPHALSLIRPGDALAFGLRLTFQPGTPS